MNAERLYENGRFTGTTTDYVHPVCVALLGTIRVLCPDISLVDLENVSLL